VRGLEDIADHVERELILAQETVLRDTDSDGGISNGRTIQRDLGFRRRGDDAVFLRIFRLLLAEQIQELAG
jgi:hypothetical protein